MGRHTGPKGKVNRALGLLVYENGGARRALERRDQPPGMHVRRRKLSGYALALREKKKIQHYYGLRERQLLRFFDQARRQAGNTGEALLVLCERRLDNVIRRAGLARTRPQARQGVSHGHFLVNGRKVDIPSYLVQLGDVIRVRSQPTVQAFYRSIQETADGEVATWIQADREGMEVTITSLPAPGDVSLPVEIGRVVELLSR